MRSQNFGIEIEMTGITRSTAAKVIAGYFHTDATHVGGCYDAYSVRDNDSRMWKIMRDASVRCENRSGQNASSLYSVEFVTPICNYDDIETIQELVRKLRGAGARVNSSCGLHCHINAAPHTPETLRNIVNIMAAKEDLLYKALKVNVSREYYCQKMDTRFLDEINNRPPMSMEQIKSMWYDGEDYSYRHYDDTRYHALNLHSVFYKGTIEFRLFNSTLHAGEVKSAIQLCLAISHQALIQKSARHAKTVSDNEKYTFRTWLLRLGLIGDEFKTARHHLLKNLDGNIAWKDPAQAEKQNQGSASDFISRVMEDYAYEISGRKAYADYIATRPRAERFGSHGLFTDDGVQVQLSKVTEELDKHKGNIWTAIISIRREDAQRLGFNTGARWRDMLRTQTEALAKNLKIPMENLRWYAAFHNESHHPHVHMIAYSTVENEGYLTQKGVENLRSSFAKDIFQQDLLCIYEMQTEHRDKLRAEARDIVEDLVSKINSEIYISASIQHKLLELADRLSKTKGKKVYGYLKPDVKALVDSIVDELANDGRIKKLYDLWYEQKENIIRTYTDEMPDRIPLTQNKEFKSIKNAVIKEALKLNFTEDEAEEIENTDEESVSNPFEYEENTSAKSDLDSDRGILYPRYSIKANRNSVAVSSLYLLRYLCNIIQNQLRFEEKQKAQRTDKKLQQKINDKKQAQGLKM